MKGLMEALEGVRGLTGWEIIVDRFGLDIGEVTEACLSAVAYIDDQDLNGYTGAWLMGLTAGLAYAQANGWEPPR